MPFAAKVLGTLNVNPFVRVADSKRIHVRLTSGFGGVKDLVTFNADTLTGQEVLQVMRYIGRSHAGRSMGIIAMIDSEDENAARLRESVAGKCEFVTYQHLSSAEVQRILATSKTSRSGADDASRNSTKKIEELGKILHKASVLKPMQSSSHRTAGVKDKQFNLYYRDYNSKTVRVEQTRKWIEKGTVSEKFIVVPNDNAAVEMLRLAQLITGYSDMNPVIILDPERATEARMAILSELGAEILYDCNTAATGREGGTWAALMSVSEGSNEIRVNAAKPYEYSLFELVEMIDGQARRKVTAALQQSQPTRWGGNFWRSGSNDTYGFAITALNALSFGSADTSAYNEALDIWGKEAKSGDFPCHYVKLVFAEQNVTEIAKFEERINRTTEQLAGLCTIYNRLFRRYGIQVCQSEGAFIRSTEVFDLLGGREFARAFIEDGINVDDLIPAPSL